MSRSGSSSIHMGIEYKLFAVEEAEGICLSLTF